MQTACADCLVWRRAALLTANMCCSNASGCTDGHRLGKFSTILPSQEVDDTVEQERLHTECQINQ